MAAGLPVVATGVGGTPEIVSPATGVLVPARDPARSRPRSSRSRRTRMRGARLGPRGRRAAEERFSLDRMIAQYLAVYRGDA